MTRGPEEEEKKYQVMEANGSQVMDVCSDGVKRPRIISGSEVRKFRRSAASLAGYYLLPVIGDSIYSWEDREDIS